jgi:benzoyl-CoA-dihydrodiol lyase
VGATTIDSPSAPRVSFETSPERYRHWRLAIEGPVARLSMDVQEEGGVRPGYELKLNSYDLGVDVELADAVQRLRFEHPEVRALLVSSAKDRIFCAGANIFMLGSSSHAFKVNFCKFTNETRLSLEDASRTAGLRSVCAVNGTCAGGGYELAVACDEILLKDDGSSAVSLPEVPLLGVLPGTGGLTRVVDKRKVRRDLADVFASLAEGVKGRRAKEWRLVDEAIPSSRFRDGVEARLRAVVETQEKAWSHRKGPGVAWTPLDAKRHEGGASYRHVEYAVDADTRSARVTIKVPSGRVPASPAEARAQGADWWILRTFRELDDVLLDLRFHRLEVGLVTVTAEGDPETVRATDALLAAHGDPQKGDWFVAEVRSFVRRTLKRMDLTAKSFFALATPGSCFVGTILEVALAADRVYARDDEDGKTTLGVTAVNRDAYPMSNGLSRLATRFLHDPSQVDRVLATDGPIGARDALALGLATFAPDDIDWDDEVRLAVEERASLSPDALTGMEANLRFAGPETMETKIFGRLSAWQNWIFQRPNAVGERGALSLYGKPLRPEFDWRRT